MNTCATEVIHSIYREGDIDIIFFGQLLSYVSARQSDDTEAVPYKKRPEHRLANAIQFVHFLVSSGDFYAQRGHRSQDGAFSYRRFENGVTTFEETVRQQFADGGIDSLDLYVTTSIVKILPGRKPPDIPVDVASLVTG